MTNKELINCSLVMRGPSFVLSCSAADQAHGRLRAFLRGYAV